MNLQKLVKTTLIVLCITLSLPAVSNSVTSETGLSNGPGKSHNKTADPLLRLKEIKEMNKENLSRAEKKALRKEVKEIRKEMKGGIYLSVGAIIIIVLLLILLL